MKLPHGAQVVITSGEHKGRAGYVQGEDDGRVELLVTPLEPRAPRERVFMQRKAVRLAKPEDFKP